jgi:hypothetical protein
LKRLILSIVAVSFAVTGFAQTFLLFHKNRYREAHYVVSDVITFRLKGERKKIKAEIIGFEDGLIVFNGFKVSPKDITHLYVDPKTRIWYALRFKYARMCFIAGAGYMLIDLANHGDLQESTVVVGTTLITAGVLAQILVSWKIKIKGRRRLEIIRAVEVGSG